MTINAKVFLISASIGIVVAVVLSLLIRYAGIDLPDWVMYVWPTLVVLGGISGHASLVAEITAIGISAFLNGAIYGFVGWILFRLAYLLKHY